MRVGQERDAFGAHLLEAAVDDVLFQFEVGNAVAQQAADAVVLLIYGDRVAGAAQLLRSGQTGWAAADDRDALAGVVLGWFRLNPAFFPGALHDALFDDLDGNGRLINAQHTGGFARRGADAAGEFGEVVGGVQAANGALPAVVVGQVVPVGNEVVYRAAGVAEGHAAIHAARCLVALLLYRERLVDFEPVVDAFFDWAARGLFAIDFEKAGNLTHVSPRLRQPEATHWSRIFRSGQRRERACTRGGKP